MSSSSQQVQTCSCFERYAWFPYLSSSCIVFVRHPIKNIRNRVVPSDFIFAGCTLYTTNLRLVAAQEKLRAYFSTYSAYAHKYMHAEGSLKQERREKISLFWKTQNETCDRPLSVGQGRLLHRAVHTAVTTVALCCTLVHGTIDPQTTSRDHCCHVKIERQSPWSMNTKDGRNTADWRWPDCRQVFADAGTFPSLYYRACGARARLACLSVECVMVVFRTFWITSRGLF